MESFYRIFYGLLFLLLSISFAPVTTVYINVTEFAKGGLIHAIINIEKSRFEILNTVYLENAWCLVYEILHQSIVIQGNSVGVLFDGLLAELPAILDSFFHQYHK